MQKIRKYILTTSLLEAYQNAALKNASELIEEAKLLFSNKHYARAYFLAAASIEETGKAILAFDAKRRNLNDGGLCKKIKQIFEDHSIKITNACACCLPNNIKLSDESIENYIEAVRALKHGREKSMYIDVEENNQAISIPSDVVRPIVAKNCIILAQKCLDHTKMDIDKNLPQKTTSHEDRLMCIKQKNFAKMVSTKDFREYYKGQFKKGNTDWPKIAVNYHDCYYQKKKMFNAKKTSET